MDILDIIPFVNQCSGSTTVPGSKSISNRALVLAALSDAKIQLSGMLESEDVNLMRKALVSLGLRIEDDLQKNVMIVHGCGGKLPVKEKEIFVGNAGTVARFLTAFLAIQESGAFKLDGTEAMRRRPMGELIDCLEGMGCKFKFLKERGCFPFTIMPSGLKGNNWSVNAEKSSQVLSALLMIAPSVNKKTYIQFPGGTVSEPFVDLTIKMMKNFSSEQSIETIRKDSEISISSTGYTSKNFAYDIEPDATAASYFLTLPYATTGSCMVQGFRRSMDQGDSRYVDVLEELGNEVVDTLDGSIAKFNGSRSGGKFNFNAISDTFLSLAAVSPLMNSNLKIEGIGHTRMQETDRVMAMASELRKLGQTVEETHDSLTIKPDINKLRDSACNGISIDTYHDHRFAMSFAILGSHNLFEDGKPWLRIKDPFCCGKTFPNFFDHLEKLRLQSDQ